MKDWEDLADWYDNKQGDKGDLWHRTIIDPTLLKVIGNCRGKDVLDLGCGNGYLSRKLARAGAKITAVDRSLRMIANAKRHDQENILKIRYVRSEADRLKGVRGSGFDLVFANMSLMDIKNANGAIGEVSRVLRPGGRFVASMCHPCYDTMSNSGWVAEKSVYWPAVVYRKVRAYRTPFMERSPWNLGEGRRRYTKSYHRPLNWYARALYSHGLAITALEEPEPTQEFFEEEQKKPGDLDGRGFREVPLHLVIEAIKL